MPLRAEAPIGAPCWVDIMTSDPAKTQAFYTELFGWTVDDPGPDYGGYVNFHRDGVPVAGCMGHSGEGPAQHLVDLPRDRRRREDVRSRRCARRHGHVPADGRHGPRQDVDGPRPRWRRDRHLAARRVQTASASLAEPNTPALVRAAHACDYDEGACSSTATCSSGTRTRRATRTSSATRRSAKARPARRRSWTRPSSSPTASPAHWSIYFAGRRHRRHAREGRQARRCQGDHGRGHAVRPARGRDRPDGRAVQVRLGHELLSTHGGRVSDRRDAPAGRVIAQSSGFMNDQRPPSLSRALYSR